jgi:hypothetical protein
MALSYLSCNSCHTFKRLSAGFSNTYKNVRQEARFISTRERLGHVERGQVRSVTTKQLHHVHVNIHLLVYIMTYYLFDGHVLDKVFKM